ncbi:MFS transporter [Comamonas flocculans]|uniref:MFS transporter n=1 Tax=Comamonas flocculans TaxID=2597701 RepID=A0A5B8RT85_9BURK|nr:MFS transporter [Comamonas flocculans]QEA12859.1 MFS transporter [Comamonas flocculans]
MPPAATATLAAANPTRYRVLGAISFSHMLNDMIQSLILAIYPILKGDFNLSFLQIGLITLTYQLTASMLQPLVGLYTDRHPKPHSLAFGMGSTLCGLLLLSVAPNFIVILIAAALVGTGSSVFHPESSRIARLASGGQHGLAQSIFQVGGNTGSALGPLLAALIVLPHGQGAIAWFALAALVAIAVLWQIGNWYQRQFLSRPAAARKVSEAASPVPHRLVVRAIAVLLVLIFSKYFYLAGITSYYTFYLIQHFGVSVQASQIHLFVFLFAVAAGTLAGGPIGDHIGRKPVIWVSILGVAPFTLALPHVNLMWTGILIFIIGLVIASAFSAILVYAQELMPGKIGAVSGMFFGFAFGMGGIGAAVLGVVADSHGIEFVYQICAFLPLLGLLTIFLPTIEHPRRKAA